MGLDWKAIHPLNGSRGEAFEELCAQLARAQTPDNAKFERKGVPDAGVECFCILPDSSEWGWQAKYFLALGDSQWSQLDKSVKSALDKHPALVRYYICAPMDRPDARVSGRNTAMRRWDEHVQKWSGWARDMGRNVEYLWWGSSELVDLLSKQSESGRLLFWFGEVEFNQSWFRDRLGEAIKAAGPRYTPEAHVELDIVQRLAAFARTGEAFDHAKSLARELRKELRLIVPSSSKHDDPLERLDLRELPQLGNTILEEFAALESTPVDEIHFAPIANKIGQVESATAEVLEELSQLERDYDVQDNAGAQAYSYRNNPYTNWWQRINRLRNKLRETRSSVSLADQFFNNRLMILKGDGGTGKTHLLCDFASKRVSKGGPVVLLLGQWFSQQGEPWTQLLQQLGLPGRSPEQFIGALESAAQALNSRALVMIDALNEGLGGEIWLSHLASFLARLERSPWIGVVLAVRSSYEESVLAPEVEAQAAIVTHQGFAGREYDAVQTYFSFYDLEFPSTPILQPEFTNPLFLKTLCEGLHHKGERRIPHGFHGITAAFDLFLEAINGKLAAPTKLDYNPNDYLVRRSLERVAKQLIDTTSRLIPGTRAQEIVDELLPGRTFSNSLYRGLVTEGILVEDKAWWTNNPSEDIVRIAYDRFADHIIADYLLQTHLDSANPAAAFSDTGGLAFLWEKQGYAPIGLVEALSVQVPERTGQELVRLAPRLWDDPHIGEAFLGSIVWRNLESFSEDTNAVLMELIEAGKIRSDPLESLLTVSIIPEHYFNAEYLDRRLRSDTMAERDACWSTYLHRTWGKKGPVDRLVDWASNVSPNDQIEPAVVDLAAITLAWMLTTPNRILRDKATKALVSLLTSRLESAIRLVEHFADLDDPYVTERVYAVAYGVAMRSHNVNSVAQLASIVYKHVFASGTPPAHILLRDYARGVIERAICLGADVLLDEKVIRPTYNSTWPSIPCEDCIEELTPNQTEELQDNERLEFARNSIIGSVVGFDDFARRVIGVESSSNWLSLPLGDAPWQSLDDRLQILLSKLTDKQKSTWDQFKEAESTLNEAEGKNSISRITQSLLAQSEGFLEFFRTELTEAQMTELDSILQDYNDEEHRNGPRFDPRLIQRYILWRVFDLGWTVERFGDFDDTVNRRSGTEASKPEHIGKKYQWIAYHEILAHIADHFQYRERFGSDQDKQRYEGPWQGNLRDIDPSCALKSTSGGTSSGSHNPSWWGAESHENWDEDTSHRVWLSNCHDIANIGHLLEVVNPNDGSRWFNVNGSFVWQQPHPADEEPFDRNRREVWIGLKGYFVRAGDADTFIAWAKNVNFWGRWMPEPPEGHSLFLGEYGWSPVFKHQYADCACGKDWIKPQELDGEECPVEIQPASFNYFFKSGGSESSIEESYTLRLPHQDFINHLGLRWSGEGADYLDEAGNLATFDPTAHENGPTALLLREDLLRQYLTDRGLALCWVAIGEKGMLGGDASTKYRGHAKISGVYSYNGQALDGSMSLDADVPDCKDDSLTGEQWEDVTSLDAPGS